MSSLSAAAYLNALPSALIATDIDGKILFLNHAAEVLFGASAQQVTGQLLSTLLPLTDEELDRVSEVFHSSHEISLYERTIALPQGHARATLHITPVMDAGGKVDQALFTIENASGPHSLAASEWKKETTRAAGVMAAMLAHEVKNPLSGIRGAAQFLHDEVSEEHKPLTELICLETDRVRDLLAQVDVFAAGVPPELQPVNIHEVLQHVISVASAGFAKHVTIVERYDPSLPQVSGHRDLMVQLFLNLIKNAAEALRDREDATVTIITNYKSGYRIRSAQSSAPVALPIIVSIEDNGPGIDEALRARLFEPFVSSKEEGRGLGLAVSAKIAADLGAVVELDESHQKGARFNVMLACTA